MDTWDSRFTFTADEANLFARLHNKATKFPIPEGILVAETETVTEKDVELAEIAEIVVDSQTAKFTLISSELSSFKAAHDHSHNLLRHLDLLLEAHKQLSLALPAADQEEDVSVTPLSPRTDELEGRLQSVQARIAHLESVQSARSFLSTLAIPSAASSPLFIYSLLILHSQEDRAIIERAHRLMEKCWDNAMVAMERVLDRDLVSLEAYLDDRVYRDLRDLVLKPLIQPYKNQLPETLTNHFASSYAQLRINFICLVLDARLNSQFDSLQPNEQILHLIERTRLIMTAERREFSEIFSNLSRQNLNKILENVGNLLFQRIEPLCTANNSTDDITSFLHPLMNSFLKNDPADPFGLFLKLLTERFFPETENANISVEVKYVDDLQTTSDPKTATTDYSNVLNV